MFLCDGLILTHISVDEDVCSFCETLDSCCREPLCGLLKAIATEAEKLLLDRTPPRTCPFYWPKIHSVHAWSSWSSWSLCSSWSSGQTGLIDRTHGTDRRQVREDRQICHLNLIFQVTCVRTAFAILAMFFWRFPLHYTLWPDWWRIVRPLPGIESSLSICWQHLTFIYQL